MKGTRVLLLIAFAGGVLAGVSPARAFTVDPRGSAPPFFYNGHYYERRHVNGQFTGDVISFDLLKSFAHSQFYNGLEGHLLRIDTCDELDALRAVENNPSGNIFGLVAAFKSDNGEWQWRDGPGANPPVMNLPACLNIPPDDQFVRPECGAVHKTIFWGGGGPGDPNFPRGNFPQQPPSAVFNDFFRSWNYQDLGGNGCGFTPDIVIEYEGGVTPTWKQTWGKVKTIYR